MSQQASNPTLSPHSAPPFWRDVRVLSIIAQVVFVGLIVLAGSWVVGNVASSMQRMGMPPISYEFMQGTAGFEIGQTPIPYEPSDSYWRAFQVGVVNTILVSLVSIVLATLVGVVVGITQLSSNWLVSRIAQIYVAIFRNIPLLLQLLFWYFAVFQKLPRVNEAIGLPGLIYISNRGIAMVGPSFQATAGPWFGFLLVGFVAAAGASHWLKVRQERTGQPGPRLLVGSGLVLLSGLIGWLVLNPHPFSISMPQPNRFNIVGGVQFSPEFAALLFGLTIYTGAFIAENVRAGIQGVPTGQKEAARALGLSGNQSMRLVVLPQALRIIIPPTTSQYLNLTKNSSLAIAIAYSDIFNITRTFLNQTGQTIPIIGLIMVSYLTISLTTSLFMNLYNRRVRLVER